DEAGVRDRVLAVLQDELVQLVRPRMERDLEDRDLELVDGDGLEHARVRDVLGLGAEPALLSELSCLHLAPPPLPRVPQARTSRSRAGRASAGTAARRSAGSACGRTSPPGGGPRRPTGPARPAARCA